MYNASIDYEVRRFMPGGYSYRRRLVPRSTHEGTTQPGVRRYYSTRTVSVVTEHASGNGLGQNFADLLAAYTGTDRRRGLK